MCIHYIIVNPKASVEKVPLVFCMWFKIRQKINFNDCLFLIYRRWREEIRRKEPREDEEQRG